MGEPTTGRSEFVEHLKNVLDRDNNWANDEKNLIIRAVNSYEALLGFVNGGCPHGCTDGNCPFDRKVKDFVLGKGTL